MLPYLPPDTSNPHPGKLVVLLDLSTVERRRDGRQWRRQEFSVEGGGLDGGPTTRTACGARAYTGVRRRGRAPVASGVRGQSPGP